MRRRHRERVNHPGEEYSFQRCEDLDQTVGCPRVLKSSAMENQGARHEDGPNKLGWPTPRGNTLASLKRWRSRMRARLGTPSTLPEYEVVNLRPNAFALNSMAARLERARDERPLQRLFAEHPNLLTSLVGGGHGRWCRPKPSLAGQFEPDFLLGDRSSVGYEWFAVELESPSARALTKSGLMTRQMNTALRQVRQWRAWAAKNVNWLESQGYLDIDGDFAGYFIMIGRRESWSKEMRTIYRELSADNIWVMSYDRVLEMAIEEAQFRAKGPRIVLPRLTAKPVKGALERALNAAATAEKLRYSRGKQ